MSPIVEVLIGMIFLYSLLSILVTQLNSVVSQVLNLRTKHLRGAIRELVQDPEISAKIIAHPLIQMATEKVLPDQRLDDSQVAAILEGKMKHLTWIDPHTFVSALMDVIRVDSDKELFGALLDIIDKMPSGEERRRLRATVHQVMSTGEGLADLRLRDLRRHIGLVLQDVFLFSGTVERNITLENPDITPEMVRSASALVGADRFVERLPAGYEEDVRERGSSLSHGQRQMLSFVRALVYRPEILVLDEATSSVDTETEHAIQEALERLLEGRTSVIIAHRLSTIQHADQILVMHHGQVRERGNHQELLAIDGLYRRLYELQYREQEQASTA